MLDFKLKIPFFNAKAAYYNRQELINEAIQKVLSRGTYINGPEVAEFASNLAAYLNVGQVIPCGNGTDALCLALMALDLNPGDEVMIPAFNFIAAAEAVALLGFKPVFVEVDENSFNVDCAAIEGNITKRTKAIIVVHLFGLSSQMEQVLTIAKRNKLFVIEDVAQSLGGSYNGQKLGTLGHIGCTSFFPTKNLACFGDGGAVFTNDLVLAKKIKMLANHGQQKKYNHVYIGLNSRLDTIQAAVLNVQLSCLDKLIENRRGIASYYLQNLKGIAGISLPQVDENHTYNQFCILLQNKELRDGLKFFLAENGVDTMVYYPIPTHLQLAFAKNDYKLGDLPVSEKLCDQILALPIYPGLSAENQTYIINLIISFTNETK